MVELLEADSRTARGTRDDAWLDAPIRTRAVLLDLCEEAYRRGDWPSFGRWFRAYRSSTCRAGDAFPAARECAILPFRRAPGEIRPCRSGMAK
ncbi:MAG TPA: hypothetical protein VMF53_07440 [Alphaproteobacteria bacterium]|nr:hypothetical protein [Alphaproteobacteria bacterium]